MFCNSVKLLSTRGEGGRKSPARSTVSGRGEEGLEIGTQERTVVRTEWCLTISSTCDVVFMYPSLQSKTEGGGACGGGPASHFGVGGKDRLIQLSFVEVEDNKEPLGTKALLFKFLPN